MPDSKGIVQSNPANNTVGRHNRSFSTFDESLSYTMYNTLRFGEYTPSFEMEGVPTDEVSVNSKDLIDSLSLNAPFKGQIRKIKESFSVPLMAILPRNWDLIYTQPSNGDDVPQDANCVVFNFPSRVFSMWRSYMQYTFELSPSTFGSNEDTAKFYTSLLRTLILGEYFYSHGSLLNVCGYKMSAQFRYLNTNRTEVYSYDQWFDMVCSKWFAPVQGISVNNPDGTIKGQYRGLAADARDYHFQKSFRVLLSDFRENPALYISTINVDTSGSSEQNSHRNDSVVLRSAPVYDGEFDSNNFVNVVPVVEQDTDDITALSPDACNLSRVLAYQLVCAHFYSNSSIDFIYSAELYRQYINSLFDASSVNTQTGLYFEWNGHQLEYDVLSGHHLSYLFTPVPTSMWTSVPTSSVLSSILAAFAAIFGYRRSLRYGDYFVGARPRPLAPVNTDVSVNNNMVSVVNITRNIQAQRFANAVMRSRSKIEEYVKSLFGKAPAPDYHNPFFLTRQTEMVFGDDVQNTAEGQVTAANSRTANFSSMVDNHTFTFHNDDSHPCIYLQIISFDIRRAYTRSVDRQFLHVDRYDMFNPDFQYIGDQPVYGIELGYPYNGRMPSIFAYQTRDQEYKQRFDVASGGFVENLPGWILTDGFRSFDEVQNIDPDFIRSYQTELDQFYLSLTGFSLGSYFHFICITRNNVSAKRPMAVDPQILA